MRVIFDTNVVVSAALKDRVPETVVLFVAEHADFEWVASRDIIAEYEDVLQRPKFQLPESVIQRWRDAFRQFVTVVEVEQTIAFPRDVKDAKFLECALSAGAHYLVTGDKDFEEAQKVGNTTILSVSLFKSLVCDRWDQPDEQAR
jgi:putative PIN family toxin of toxin-antitoxin system